MGAKFEKYKERNWPTAGFLGDKVIPYEVQESYDVHVDEDIIRSERWLERAIKSLKKLNMRYKVKFFFELVLF